MVTESPATTVATQATVDESAGGVTADCRHRPRKITICHKGQTLQVSLAALFAHLRHGDRLGACKTTETCPCFTSQGIADIAAQCSVAPVASCPTQYSLGLSCAASGSELGLFEATVGMNTCSTTTVDPLTGDPVTVTMAVTPGQYTACKAAIVGSAYYPASCPR
jgi:hypothetical protein